MKHCLYLLSGVLETVAVLLAVAQITLQRRHAGQYRTVNKSIRSAATLLSVRPPDIAVDADHAAVADAIAATVNEATRLMSQQQGTLLYATQDIIDAQRTDFEELMEVHKRFPALGAAGAVLLLAGVWTGYAANIMT